MSCPTTETMFKNCNLLILAKLAAEYLATTLWLCSHDGARYIPIWAWKQSAAPLDEAMASPHLRPAALIAATLGLIQGLIWTALSLYGLLLASCAAEADSSKTTTGVKEAIIEIYFLGPDCKKQGFDGQVVNADSMVIITTFYLIFSSLWTVSSVGLIIEFFSPHGKKFTAGIIILWLIVTCFNIGLDVAVTVAFGVNYNKVEKYVSTFSSLETQRRTALPTAAGLMMGLGARFFLLWIVNLALAVHLMVEANTLRREAYRRRKVSAFSQQSNLNFLFRKRNEHLGPAIYTVDTPKSAATSTRSEPIGRQDSYIPPPPPQRHISRSESLFSHSYKDTSPYQAFEPNPVQQWVVQSPAEIRDNPWNYQHSEFPGYARPNGYGRSPSRQMSVRSLAPEYPPTRYDQQSYPDAPLRSALKKDNRHIGRTIL